MQEDARVDDDGASRDDVPSWVQLGNALCREYVAKGDKARCAPSQSCGLSHAPVDWKKLLPRVPRDPYDPRWAQSFEPSDVSSWKPFLRHYGYVVLRVFRSDDDDDGDGDDVVDPLCEAVVRDQEALVQAAQRADDVDDERIIGFDAPVEAAWDTDNWPSRSKFLLPEPALTASAFALRTHARLYEVWKHVFDGATDLWSTIDHFGIMRGTRGLRASNGLLVDRPDWEVQLPPHWDLDPFAYASQPPHVPRRYQGLIALRDCPEEVGGFCVVPGIAHHLDLWTCKVRAPPAPVSSYHPNPNDKVAALQRVPIRAGEVVIWDSGSCHANFRNTSDRMRLVLYSRYMPAEEASAALDSRAPGRMLEQWGTHMDPSVLDSLTPLGRRLTGLDPWPSSGRVGKKKGKKRGR